MPPRSRSQRSASADSSYGMRSCAGLGGVLERGERRRRRRDRKVARGIVSGRLQVRVGGRLRPGPVHGHAHAFPGPRARQEPARRGECRERERERGDDAPGRDRARRGAGGRDRLLDMGRRGRRSRRRVREVLLGREAAAPEIEDERCGERKQQDERRRGAGDDEVGVRRAQEQERRVDGIHREMPHEEREDVRLQHHGADEDPRETHLEAPDVEGLVRIRAVREAPDERRDHDGGPARQEPLGEGNREHARRELLGRRGEKAHQENAGPGEPRAEEVRVRHVGGSPRAEARGDEVEDDLVREEERRHRVSEEESAEEPLRARCRGGRGGGRARACRDSVSR